MRRFIDQYFGLIALVFIALSALGSAVIRRSLLSGLLGGLAAVGVIIVFFILLGLVGAAMERLEELRSEASEKKVPLPAVIARAWAWGLILWIPAGSLLTQFLLVWAAVGTTAIILLPRFATWSFSLRACAVAVLVAAAGFINAAFHRGEP